MSAARDDGGPSSAPARLTPNGKGTTVNTTTQSNANTVRPAMSEFDLRDHFAGLAMKALITKGMDDYAKRGMRGVPLIPKYAYEYADAMIKERSK